MATKMKKPTNAATTTKTPRAAPLDFGSDPPEKKKPNRALRGFSVTQISAIRPDSLGDNLITRAWEAAFQPAATLNKQTQVASQGKNKIIATRAHFENYIETSLKEALSLVKLGRPDAARHYYLQAIDAQKQLDQIQAKVASIQSMHGTLEQAKVNTIAAKTMMLTHNVIRELGGQVDNDATAELLTDLNEETNNIDGASSILGQSVGRTMEEAESEVDDMLAAAVEHNNDSRMLETQLSVPRDLASLSAAFSSTTTVSPTKGNGGGGGPTPGGNSRTRVFTTANGELERVAEAPATTLSSSVKSKGYHQRRPEEATTQEAAREEFFATEVTTPPPPPPPTEEEVDVPLERKKKHKKRKKGAAAATATPAPPTPRDIFIPEDNPDDALCSHLLDDD